MIVYWRKHRVTLFPISADVVVGRSPQHATVILPSERVSRRHAVIRQTAAGIEIEDLRSRNGTFVNGERLEGTTTLKSGDTIVIGDEQLSFIQKASRDIPRTMDEAPNDDIVTTAHRNAVELIEELVVRAAETGERKAIASSVQSMVDSLLTNAQQAGTPMQVGESVRIVSVARIVAGWFVDGSMKSWADSVEQSLNDNGSNTTFARA